MKNKLLVIFLLFNFFIGFAQPKNQLIQKNTKISNYFEVLPDKGYTIEQVSTDTNLQFKAVDSLYLKSNNKFWIKYTLYNTSNYDENVVLYFNPAMENTFFQFDSSQQKWVSQKAGFRVAGRYFYNPPSSILTIRRNEAPVNYILCNATEFQKYIKSFKPELYVVSEKSLSEKKALPFYAWGITMVILLLFFLYNAYLYFFLKDKTYLYFLLLQIGAAIYVTAATKMFNYLVEAPFCSLFTNNNGEIMYFEKNNFANRLSTIWIIISFVQLTRHFLATHIKTPTIDKRLKLILGLYIVVELAMIIASLTHSTLPTSYNIIENVTLLLVVGYIFYATWYSYKHSYKPAFYLLMANLIPLSIILVLICSLLWFKFFTGFVQILPDIAAVSQAFTFAIALHLRLKNLKLSLHQQQEEALTLKQQIETLVKRQETIAKENEIIAEEIEVEKSKNEELLQKLEANQRELASNTMFMYQKNSLLSYLKGQMKELNKMLPESATQTSKNIDASLQNHQFLEADWDKFKLHFENVHPSFFEDLKKKYPDLTKNETRLCAYLHLNMSTKEIAALLNIDPGSVRRAKTRLNKKMNLQPSDLD
jgi:hypothetical protein